MIESSVEVNGFLLRTDREAALLSRDALAAATDGHVSAETIRRAEIGRRIQRTKLRFIAKAMGQTADRYAVQVAVPTHTALNGDGGVDLTGAWKGFWIESHRLGDPFLIEEDVQLTQTGTLVRGRFQATVDGTERAENILFARLDRRTLTCVTEVDGWVRPNGTGTFQVHVGRNDNWMDGYTIWDDADTEQIEVSRYVCIRMDDPETELLLARAKQMMDGAKEAYKWRRGFWNS